MHAQGDALAKDTVKALKGLKNVLLVTRFNSRHEAVNARELADVATVSLGRDIPRLALLSEQKDASNWLELSIIQDEFGGLVEVLLYRSVLIVESGDIAFVPVWQDLRQIVGLLSANAVKDALREILTKFAADYYRANGGSPPR